MAIYIILIVLFLFVIYCFLTALQTKQRLSNHGELSVTYLFQVRPGQYSGDRSVKSGVIVIDTTSYDKKLKHATLNHVQLNHPDVYIQLEQPLTLIFHYDGLKKYEVSIRYKVLNRDLKTLDLTGVLTTISGKLYFEDGKTNPFKILVPISGLYQAQ